VIKENRVKRALRAGGVALGTMVSHVRTPSIAVMLKAAGFDFFFIDSEHGAFNLETVQDIALVAREADIVPILRVPGLSDDHLFRPLDAGVMGLLCPHVETGDQAHHIVRATKYYPLGERGMSLRNIHTGFVRGKGDEVTRRLNEETLLAVQVETAKGVDNIDAIVAVEGIDAVYVGPNDLSQTVGVPGQIHHPEVTTRIDRVIAACNRAGVAPGLHTYDVESAQGWLKKGIRLLGFAGDSAFIIDAGAKAVTDLRSSLRPRP
jgi:2-keto-3-deoxy-L-rhamnonate aldolase RhmA